jgi:hypothetical protein
MLGNLKCECCKQPIEGRRDDVPIHPFDADPDEIVTLFFRAHMHWACYAAWEYRERYEQLHFDDCVRQEALSPAWHRVYLDQETFATVYPGKRKMDVQVRVHVKAMASAILVGFSDWEKWLEEDVASSTPSLLAVGLARAKQCLREAFPKRDGLLAAIDLSRKAELYAQLKIQERAAKAAEAQVRQQMVLRNKACEAFMEQVKKSPVACDHCKADPGEFRLAQRGGRPTAIICRKCGMVREPEGWNL